MRLKIDTNTIISLILILALAFTQCQSNKKMDALVSQVQGTDEIISKKINDLGQGVTTVSTKLFQYDKNLSKYDESIKALEDRLKPNGDKLKQLQSSVKFLTAAFKQQVLARSKDTLLIKEITVPGETKIVRVADIPVGTTWDFESKYITIKSMLTNDADLSHKYTLRPTAFYVDIIRKGGGLFREPLYMTRISSDNPLIDIQDSNVFLQSYPKKKWGIMLGVGASATYTNNKYKVFPAAQITIGRNLIKF